jgi:hypothetical protein
MALPNNRPLTEAVVNMTLADLSTASSAFVPSPFRGKIVRASSAITNAITTADGVWSLEINGTAVTGSSATVTQSGSAAGDVDTVIPTGANYVNEGDTIEVVATGSCDTACVTQFSIIIERD